MERDKKRVKEKRAKESEREADFGSIAQERDTQTRREKGRASTSVAASSQFFSLQGF